jgi:hypothetical protein
MIHRKLVTLLIAAGASACTGYATTPVGSAEVTSGPMDVEGADPGVDIDAAPQVMYEGRPTYFYNDSWYYRDTGGRWQHYRSEPNELREHRRTFEANRAQPQARRTAPQVQPNRPRNNVTQQRGNTHPANRAEHR